MERLRELMLAKGDGDSGVVEANQIDGVKTS